MEAKEMELIKKYYYLFERKSNVDTKNFLKLIYIMSYIKVFEPMILEQLKVNEMPESQVSIEFLINNLSVEILKNDKKENLDFIINEIKSINYPLENTSEIIKFFTNTNKEDIKKILKANTEMICKYFKWPEYTPDSISKAVCHILDIKQSDTILDIGSCLGDFLISAFDYSKSEKLNGIEIDELLYNLSELRIKMLNYKCHLINGDVFKIKANKRYNKIFCNYPFGLKIDRAQLDRILYESTNMRFNWNRIPGSSPDWLFVNVVLSMLDNNGKAAIIMPDGPLFKTADNEYKKDLINNGYIESIIKLPQSSFPYVNVGTNLIVFSNSKNEIIKFIDASQAVISDNRWQKLDINKLKGLLNMENNERIGYADKIKIAENNYVLTVDRYLKASEISYYNPVKLSNYIKDIFRGLQITPSEVEKLKDNNGEYEILKISDMDDGFISENLVRINVPNNKYDRYLINNDDIVITSKCTRIKIAVANIGNRKIIADGNLIVLRVDNSKLNPYYLAAYLLSKEGIKILKKIQTGGVIISINPGELASSTISWIALEQQNAIAEKYQGIQKEIFDVKNNLNKVLKEKEIFLEFGISNAFNNNEERSKNHE